MLSGLDVVTSSMLFGVKITLEVKMKRKPKKNSVHVLTQSYNYVYQALYATIHDAPKFEQSMHMHTRTSQHLMRAHLWKRQTFFRFTSPHTPQHTKLMKIDSTFEHCTLILFFFCYFAQKGFRNNPFVFLESFESTKKKYLQRKKRILFVTTSFKEWMKTGNTLKPGKMSQKI